MSSVRLIITLGVLLCLFACHRTPHYPSTLLRAEQLMDVAPDSALTLLTGFKDSVRAESEATQMYYQLLTVKANDKCYIPHASDSLMKVLVSYYESHGTSAQLMEVYYYQGSVYRDLQDAPRALDYFQKAIDVSVDGKEYKILGRVYSQMGILYMYQRVYDDALPVLKKAYHYYFLAKDSLLLPYALRNIGHAFTAQHNVDSTLCYYEAGYQAAKRINDVHRMSVVQGELSDIYIQLGRYEEARTALLQSSESLRGNLNLAPHYAGWGDLYRETGQWDSAMYYYYKALEIGGIYVKKGVYWSLYNMERMKAHDSAALQYMDQYQIYQDSVQKITDTEAVKKAQMLYNYHHVGKENTRLVLEKAESRKLIYKLILGSVLLLLIAIGGVFYLRKKGQYQLEQEQKLRFFEDERNKANCQQIEQNLVEIELLKKQLKVTYELNESEKEPLTLNLRLLEGKTKMMEAACMERQSRIEAFYQSAIYHLVHEKSKEPNSKLSSENWAELQKAIDATYANFTTRILVLYPKITEIELRVCYLIKASVSVVDIAHLVVREKSSVTNIRRRLYKKIHGVDGTAKELDAFIVVF